MGLIISTEPVVARTWVDGFFSSFRKDGLPTIYPSNKTPVTLDVLECGFIYAALILFISFLVILPGIRGLERLFCFIRFTVSLFIGLVIMLGIWGNGWEVGHIHTRTQYRAFTGYEIEADIQLKIGLHNMNITLTGTPIVQPVGDINETVNYNERFWWSFPWGQGRIGFGRFSSEVNQEFRAAQYKGLPYPILWVAEYFIFDGEGIRWGRYYRHAGFYTHIVLWLAFPLWLLSNIMFFIVPRNGAFFLFLTGLCMLSGNTIYACYRNPTALQVPFEDGVLKLSWGPNFWLNLFSGVLCLIIACFVQVFELVGFDSELASFFGTNELKDVDEYYLDEDTVKGSANKSLNEGPVLNPNSASEQSIEAGLLHPAAPGGSVDSEGSSAGRRYSRQESVPTLKKRGFSTRLRKTQPKKPRPMPRRRPPPTDVIAEEAEDDQMYENVVAGSTTGVTVIRFSNNNGLGSETVNVEVPN